MSAVRNQDTASQMTACNGRGVSLGFEKLQVLPRAAEKVPVFGPKVKTPEHINRDAARVVAVGW